MLGKLPQDDCDNKADAVLCCSSALHSKVLARIPGQDKQNPISFFFFCSAFRHRYGVMVLLKKLKDYNSEAILLLWRPLNL